MPEHLVILGGQEGRGSGVSEETGEECVSVGTQVAKLRMHTCPAGDLPARRYREKPGGDEYEKAGDSEVGHDAEPCAVSSPRALEGSAGVVALIGHFVAVETNSGYGFRSSHGYRDIPKMKAPLNRIVPLA